MFVITFGVVLLVSSALSRNVQNFGNLDEEDQELFRAAYEEPSYPENSYNYYETPSNDHEYDNQIPVVKLDLLKDGMWALKAKMLQLKAFNKAMVANLLTTKLKLKELLEHQKKLPKHLHVEEKPVHNYLPTPPVSYAQYEKPHPQYAASAVPQYPASPPQYSPPTPQYTASTPQYSPPAQHYAASAAQYSPPAPQYAASAPSSPPAPQYTAPAPQYSPPATQYIAPALPEYTEPEYNSPASAASQRPQHSKPAPQSQDSSPQYIAPQATQYTAQHYGSPQHDPYYGQ